MRDTITRYLTGVKDELTKRAIRVIVDALGDRYSSCALSQHTLAISSGGATTAKIATSDCYAVANGVLVKVANATVLPALTGINAAAGFFNVACFYVDAAGTVTVAGGTQGATLGAVVFPNPPQKKAMIGFLIITYASAFTGGTTPLDTATTVYLSPDAAFDPTVLLGTNT